VYVANALADAGLSEVMNARYLASTALRVLCARTGRSRVFAYDERTEALRPASALHVARADFDLVLARAARAYGATVYTGTRAEDPELRGDTYALALRGADGKQYEIEARFVIDASGEARWMSARASTPSERDGLDGTVMETHVAYAQPSAGAPSGAADLVSFAHGRCGCCRCAGAFTGWGRR
jgi:flavin-dependent dehydrogenase